MYCWEYRHYFPEHLKALERDKNKCVKCGSTNSIIVHHKDESRKFGIKNLNNNLGNLITLCRSCHAEIHNQTLRFTNPNINLIQELRHQNKTYQEVGDYLGISRQRVHQIINQAEKRGVKIDRSKKYTFESYYRGISK